MAIGIIIGVAIGLGARFIITIIWHVISRRRDLQLEPIPRGPLPIQAQMILDDMPLQHAARHKYNASI